MIGGAWRAAADRHDQAPAAPVRISTNTRQVDRSLDIDRPPASLSDRRRCAGRPRLAEHLLQLCDERIGREWLLEVGDVAIDRSVLGQRVVALLRPTTPKANTPTSRSRENVTSRSRTRLMISAPTTVSRTFAPAAANASVIE